MEIFWGNNFRKWRFFVEILKGEWYERISKNRNFIQV